MFILPSVKLLMSLVNGDIFFIWQVCLQWSGVQVAARIFLPVLKTNKLFSGTQIHQW